MRGPPRRPRIDTWAPSTFGAPAGYRAEYPHVDWCSKTATAICMTVPPAQDASDCPRRALVDCPPRRGTSPCYGEHLEAVTKRERKAGKKDICCYDTLTGCGMHGEGRPLRATWDAPAILAPVTNRGEDWSMELDGRAPIDPARARRWLEAARAEHASIAAFAKLSLDLLAHGAPADLLARVHRAAVDEVAHARISFAMAARFAAADVAASPGAMDLPAFVTPSLADLARETFRDGCIGEAAAAARARVAAEDAVDDAERAALLLIAEDEDGHADLAWQIVGWAGARDPRVAAIIDDEISLHAEARDRLAGLAPA